MAPKRKATTLDPEPGRSYFCRRQRSEQDIPILPTHVLGGEDHLRRTMKILKRREEKMSPFEMTLRKKEEEMSPFEVVLENHSVHVTPLPNPLSSHHILRLYSGRTPFTAIDLLIEDASIYFTAFRLVVLKRTQQTGIIPLGPGRWKVFKDQMDSLPAFLRRNADSIDMSSSYGSITIKVGGSKDCMQEIFDQFVEFILNGFEEVPNLFKQAVYAIMVIYCEIRRSLGMRNEVGKRKRELHKPGPFPPLQEATKNMWDSFSGVAIKAKKDNKLFTTTPLGDAYSVGVLKDFKLLKHLIGADGELLIAKQDRKELCRHVTEAFLDEEEQKIRRFPNVTFEIPEGFVPRWHLAASVPPPSPF